MTATPALPRISAEVVATLSPEDRAEFYASLSPEESAALLYRWEFWARDNQLVPATLPGGENWRTCLILAGRGFGKTRTGAETIRQWVESGKCKRVALVARTAADVRDVMVEGESGLLNISPPWMRPRWKPALRRLEWPNGAIATTYTGDEPSQLRGPQHDGAWADEIAAWRYPEAWDQLQFGLRLGRNPQALATTTPRPIPLIKDLIKEEDTLVIKGTTFENAANLAPAFIKKIRARYEGTRLGEQELLARILDDNPLALWNYTTIESTRVRPIDVPQLERVFVSVDPSVHDGKIDPTEETTDLSECGIVAGGVATIAGMKHAFILDDFSLFGSPHDWATRTVTAYDAVSADGVVAEINNGGALVGHTVNAIRGGIPVHTVFASRGKITRAEPVSALYLQRRVHHVGQLAELEDQMTTYIPGMKSPDRMDALVWLLYYLMLEEEVGTLTSAKYRGR